MAPKQGNTGSKNPHFRLVHGKMRFNPNTNVACGHASCQIAARAKEDKEYFKKFGNPPKIIQSNAKGIFQCVV